MINCSGFQFGAQLIIASLHDKLLKGINAGVGCHFQGLHAAGSLMRKHGLINNVTARRLRHVEVAFSMNRHIDIILAQSFLDEVLEAAQPHWNLMGHVHQPGPPPAAGAVVVKRYLLTKNGHIGEERTEDARRRSEERKMT